MKTLVLVMVAISGLTPTQKVQIVDAQHNPIAVYQVLPPHSENGLHCSQNFPSTRPLVADAQGTVQVCIEPVQDYRVEIAKAAH